MHRLFGHEFVLRFGPSAFRFRTPAFRCRLSRKAIRMYATVRYAVYEMMTRYLIEDRVMFDSYHMSLSHAGRETELTANESELLEMVLSGMIAKAEVIKHVWGDKGVIVTDSSYHQLVRSLRSRLEEHQLSGALIKTLPRQGLKFMGFAVRLDDERQLADAGADAHAPADRSALDAGAPFQLEPEPPLHATDRSPTGLQRLLRHGERILLVVITLWAAMLTWYLVL